MQKYNECPHCRSNISSGVEKPEKAETTHHIQLNVINIHRLDHNNDAEKDSTDEGEIEEYILQTFLEGNHEAYDLIRSLKENLSTLHPCIRSNLFRELFANDESLSVETEPDDISNYPEVQSQVRSLRDQIRSLPMPIQIGLSILMGGH